MKKLSYVCEYWQSSKQDVCISKPPPPPLKSKRKCSGKQALNFTAAAKPSLTDLSKCEGNKENDAAQVISSPVRQQVKEKALSRRCVNVLVQAIDTMHFEDQ